MKFRMFSEGHIGEDEKFVITLQQKIKGSYGFDYGHVGEFEITGRELKHMLAMFDALFARPTELPTTENLKEIRNGNKTL